MMRIPRAIPTARSPARKRMPAQRSVAAALSPVRVVESIETRRPLIVRM